MITLDLQKEDVEAVLDTIATKMNNILNYDEEKVDETTKQAYISSYQKLGDNIYQQLLKQTQNEQQHPTTDN